MAGSTEVLGFDFWMAKADSSGNQQWAHTYGGENDEVAHCIIQMSDAGYVLTGHTASIGAGRFDLWLVKTNPTGNMTWSKTYGGADYEEARSVVETTDGGYAVAGYMHAHMSSMLTEFGATVSIVPAKVMWFIGIISMSFQGVVWSSANAWRWGSSQLPFGSVGEYFGAGFGAVGSHTYPASFNIPQAVPSPAVEVMGFPGLYE